LPAGPVGSWFQRTARALKVLVFLEPCGLMHGRCHPIAGQLHELFAKVWFLRKLGKPNAIARVVFHILVGCRHGAPSV
jgi:hypothetical protein